MNATGAMNKREKDAWAAAIEAHPDAATQGFSCAGLMRDQRSILFDRDLPRPGAFEQIVVTPREDGTFAVSRG